MQGRTIEGSTAKYQKGLKNRNWRFPHLKKLYQKFPLKSRKCVEKQKSPAY